MRVRVRFSKFGSMKFLGHLDVMRYFQKALRRTGLKVSFTEGYSPHPIMSFAQPLALTVTSDGEYFDMEFREEYPTEEILEKMQAAMSSEFAVTKITRRDDYVENTKKMTCMSLIAKAAYYIEAKPESGVTAEVIKKFAQTEQFTVSKKTKTSEKEINLMEGVAETAYYEAGELVRKVRSGASLLDDELFRLGMVHADPNSENASLFCVLDAGSTENISVTLVCEALSTIAGVPYSAFSYRIHRMELFGNAEGEVLPLWRIRL